MASDATREVCLLCLRTREDHGSPPHDFTSNLLHAVSPSREYPLPADRCPSGAHFAGNCQCTGIPNLQATIMLLERDLAAARAAEPCPCGLHPDRPTQWCFHGYRTALAALRAERDRLARALREIATDTRWAEDMHKSDPKALRYALQMHKARAEMALAALSGSDGGGDGR